MLKRHLKGEISQSDTNCPSSVTFINRIVLNLINFLGKAIWKILMYQKQVLFMLLD